MKWTGDEVLKQRKMLEHLSEVDLDAVFTVDVEYAEISVWGRHRRLFHLKEESFDKFMTSTVFDADLYNVLVNLFDHPPEDALTICLS